ncbi:MAG: putative methyltransferase [Acidimicrobiales bacterium]|nr:putative methyltransferase [Acidimicrobiales bacterium]
MFDPSSYGDAIADVYDDWYGDISDVEGTVAAVVALAAGGPVLELGVGTGRLALPLAAAGAEVHGIDASPAMVERLRAKPGGADLPVMVGDFAEELPQVPGGFAVVLVAFNTFLNLVAPGAQERCLDRVVGALRPDGAFVVEAFVPGDDHVASGVDVRSVGTDEVVLSVFRREGPNVVGSLVSLSPAGGVRLRPWSIRPRGPEELDQLAAAAGLTLESRHAGWRGEPFTDLDDRHVTVYRRGGGSFGAVIRS